MSGVRKCAVIEFNERPVYTLEDASTQAEHLYIHVGLTQEKLNEVIERYETDRREILDRLEHLERRVAGEWPYDEVPA